MPNLKVGDEVDLGKGYDWYAETKTALAETKSFFKSNIKTINAITRAFTTISADDEESSDAKLCKGKVK